MNLVSTGPGIVDLATYRVARARHQEEDDEVVTDVRFGVTRRGRIVDNTAHVATLDTLTVLIWCLTISTNVLDQYLESIH
jgi:hypothetical protein